jgi:hypothetical protein
MQQPLYLLHCTPPFPTFINSLVSFYSSLLQMFRHFLGLRSFDSLERLLTCKQALNPIILGGIGFIPTSTFAPTTYLRSWTFVASIITIRFMVDKHSSFLKVLAQVNNIFPFQQHLKTCDLLLPPPRMCLLPFEQLIRQQMVHLQNSISKHLLHHTLFNMFSNKIFEAHHVWILSCFDPWASVWLIIQLIFPIFGLCFPFFFHNTSNIARNTTFFNYWPLLMCAHISSTLWVTRSQIPS